MQDKTISELINELKQLRVREAQVIFLLERATEQQGSGVADHGIERGDRIRIKNQVKKPSNWGDDPWVYREARLATVTHTTAERVYFVTDNGVSTWRAPHNVESIRQHE
jgi:hypothetical protein